MDSRNQEMQLERLSALLSEIRRLTRLENKEVLNLKISNAFKMVDTLNELSANNMPGQMDQELRSIYLSILTQGLNNLSGLCSTEKWEECFYEADHIHNIPAILAKNLLQDEQHYIRAEIPCSLATGCTNAKKFKPFFDKLRGRH